MALPGCSQDHPAGGRAVGAEAAVAADEAGARAAFVAYQQAVVDGRGADAASRVTAGTIDHYERLRRLAVAATVDDLAAEPMVDRLAVVLLRTRFPLGDLEAATGATVLAGAVDVGMIGRQVGALVAGDVSVDPTGERVTVSAVDGAGRLLDVDLAREGSGWKVDLTALLAAADTGLRQLAVAQGVAENDLILAMVAATTGVTIGPEIFDPPRPPD
ncbi:MAG: hypothetical protein ACRD0A_07925 [Acidimicrobiales bacterium]